MTCFSNYMSGFYQLITGGHICVFMSCFAYCLNQSQSTEDSVSPDNGVNVTSWLREEFLSTPPSESLSPAD